MKISEITKDYDPYPLWIVILTNLVSVVIYVSGLVIMSRLGWIVAVSYLIFVSFMEFRLVSKHCVNCYYWGRRCGFGKGLISAQFFRKGDSAKFCDIQMTWKDMIPDLLITAIPFMVGILLLIVKFEFKLLIPLLLLLLLTTIGNGFIRGSLTCKYCRQRELGCPAYQLFNKDK